MELNTEIWGTYEDNATNLISGSASGACFYSSKSGASDIKSYNDTHGHNDPIDETINYWQIADNSMFNSFCFIRLIGQTNALEVKTVKATSPLSLFLTKTGSTQRNITFNPAANGNTVWESDVYGTSFYSNNWKIIPWYDYNRILLRPSLSVVKLDEDGNPTGSIISTGDKSKIYNFFHDNENDVPIREQYAILSVNLRFLIGDSTYSSFSYNAYDYLYFSTSTEIESPYPNAYRVTPFRTYQTLGAMTIGYSALDLHNRISNVGSFGMDTWSSTLYIYDPAHWEVKTYVNENNQTRYYFNYTGTYDDLMRDLATLGFWFRDDVEGGTFSATGAYAKTLGPNCTDEHCCLPEILNGRTTGNFKRGRQAGADPQAQWGSDWRDNAGYNGDTPYKNEGNPAVFPYSISVMPFGHMYSMDYTDVGLLSERLSNYIFNTEYDEKIFYGQNPIDCISFIKIFPFSNGVMEKAFLGASSRITTLKIGEWDSLINAGLVDLTSVDMNDPLWEGEITVYSDYNDFRAFEPYSAYWLYIPFCGEIQLPSSVVLNNTITIKIGVDGLSGNLIAYILINNYIYKTVEGNCVLEVPLNGLKVADYKSDMINLLTSSKIAKFEIGKDIGRFLQSAGNSVMAEGINQKHNANQAVTAGALATSIGRTIDIGSDIAQQVTVIKNYKQHLDHSAPAPVFISSGGGINAWTNPLYAQLIIESPKMLSYDKEIYAKTTGHACCIYDTLGSQHENGKDNFVQVNDIILDDIALTETEKRNLLSLLQSGVII